MKMLKKLIMRVSEAEILNDRKGGLQVYTNNKVAATEQAIINISGIGHLNIT